MAEARRQILHGWPARPPLAAEEGDRRELATRHHHRRLCGGGGQGGGRCAGRRRRAAPRSTLRLPSGETIRVPILDVRSRRIRAAATAAVRKDAGDDPT